MEKRKLAQALVRLAKALTSAKAITQDEHKDLANRLAKHYMFSSEAKKLEAEAHEMWKKMKDEEIDSDYEPMRKRCVKALVDFEKALNDLDAAVTELRSNVYPRD